MYERKTRKFLKSFGAGNGYRGYYYCSYSVKLAAEDPESLSRITKSIYPEVAKKYKTNVTCIERDIRTVAEAVWKNGGKEFFYRYTGQLSEKRPSNARFLEILAQYVLSDEPIPSKSDVNPCENCKIVADYSGKLQQLEVVRRSLEEENKTLRVTIRCMNEMVGKLIKKIRGTEEV